jgi:hypothetical protein
VLTPSNGNLFIDKGDDILGANIAVGTLRVQGGAFIYSGSGSQSGVITASPGAIYLNTAGGASTTLYVKESGTGTNTGWVGK